MKHPSASLRLVSRIVRPSQPQPGLRTQSNVSPCSQEKSSTSPINLEPETLGNKLQRLAILRPDRIGSVELLVDHLLESVERNRHSGMLILALSILAQ